MKVTHFYQGITVTLAALLLAPTTSLSATIKFSAAGADPASIQGTVDAFRTALGTLNPNLPGSVGSGRREINWDGVPDAFSSPNDFPANFFNVNSPRGAVFSTPGTGFQVSADNNNPTNTPVEFDNINPTYSSIFQTFSPQRLFTALDSNIVDVNFFVPGFNTPATVSGFGAVFTDVDLAQSTKIEFFDVSNKLLFSDFAKTSNNGLSFLGAFFDGGERVGRVRITSGNAFLSANNFDGNGIDIVAMDDFLYGEPIEATGVPEPSSVLGLLLGSLIPLASWTRRRRCKSAT